MGRPEDSRVKILALVHFTRLGYTYMSIKDKERNVDYDVILISFIVNFCLRLIESIIKISYLQTQKRLLGNLRLN